MASAADRNGFEVARWVDRLGGHMERHPNFWIKLGNLESRFLRDDLGEIKIERPIYVAGLARSGSTFLLEALASHETTVTHRYKDFPPVFTPYWWHRFLGCMPEKETMPMSLLLSISRWRLMCFQFLLLSFLPCS